MFTEKKDKLNLNVSNSNNEIKISVDCFNGTIAEVSVDPGNLIIVGCGEKKVIGIASALKGQTLEFNGSANNPNNNPIKVSHKIFEVGGNEITYTFTDDNTNSTASYTFFVKFK